MNGCLVPGSEFFVFTFGLKMYTVWFAAYGQLYFIVRFIRRLADRFTIDH
jgi:hypothetical protein